MKQTRRAFLVTGTAAIGAIAMPTHATPLETDNPADWLGATKHIDTGHRRIVDTSSALTAGLSSDRDKAMAIFSFVSRQIKFGFAGGFWDNSASDVLRVGRGYCNTKSTVFVALLRASKIPARQIFVDIHASVLSGILDPGTPYVDHSYVEVFLEGGWRATDAYIVDPALFDPAVERAAKEQRLMGYGVHVGGSTEWDARASSFSQYDLGDPSGISTRYHGAYADVADFYRRADKTWNRLNPVLRAAVGAMSSGANRRAEAFRNSG